MKVIMTRTTDVYIGLNERAYFANRNKADLFVSYHLNAATATAYGYKILLILLKIKQPLTVVTYIMVRFYLHCERYNSLIVVRKLPILLYYEKQICLPI